ncbi:hypothetical protein [Clostridium algidicarnis]|uniref:Uncharacterized protein n=2 Tax=Clostridium algidicarnis TaxID=37659 RepID=A0A2S6G1I9_9CLOT|nr:hypothetical protein [Clostridium algidicarnis]MBB6631271.1 hypothetical protein [Clostridium algidicarnis]MBU3193817.1 hypothetical protein [Clostridium algidicarnis]MBU3205403.1 hypothetical protein [Clostridium algidicarnis]MBU3219841.1 hypothetical protein [Clostridium algidicarnis]MCB2285692.1 hypothetical protein [Clostridium algidicarnis]
MSDIIKDIESIKSELQSSKLLEETLDKALQVILDLGAKVTTMEKDMLELTEYAEYIERRLDFMSSPLEDYEDVIGPLDYEYDEDDYVESSCPFCGEVLFIEEQLFKSDSKIKCPNCNKTMRLEEKYLEPIKSED